MTTSPHIQAIELVAPWKFHQIFTVPASETHGQLKVTYSIAGIEYGDDVPTIVFCGAMFGSRWQAILLDWLATKEEVQVICIDRPGFGGSTPVELSQRIETFVEVVPLLLAHLKVKHVAIAAHSAGSVYALNLLSQRPDILSPKNPSITFFSPWVHQSHTSVSFLVFASMLPNNLLNHWNKLAGFMINSAQPAFGASDGAVMAIKSAFKSKAVTLEQKGEEARQLLAGFGISVDVKKEVDKLIFKYGFEENTDGVNDEARMCLKSTSGTSWHTCEDYPECVRNLAQTWENRVQDGGSKLKVKIILPGSDHMVGDKGMRYFENCWKKEKCGKGVVVEVQKLEAADHDTTTDPTKGAIGAMFREAKKSRA